MMTERFKTVIPVLGAVIAGICVLGLVLAWLGVLPGFAREEETIDGRVATPTSTIQSPPEDAMESGGTRTATFALG